MKRFPVKQSTHIPSPNDAMDGDLSSSDLPEFDLEKLLSKTGEILRREVANLLGESSKGKLSAPSSNNLVQYIKLLSELKAEKQKELENWTDEELEAALTKKE